MRAGSDLLVKLEEMSAKVALLEKNMADLGQLVGLRYLSEPVAQIPIQVRDRIMARLHAAEATVAVLMRGIKEHREDVGLLSRRGADRNLWLLLGEDE